MANLKANGSDRRAAHSDIVIVSRGLIRDLSFRAPAAFTVIELLVVIAIVGILASLLLSVLGKAKGKAQSIACLSNLKQLQLAWMSYAHANNDEMPLNHSVNMDGIQQSERGSWVVGNAQHDTNTAKLELGTLFPLIGSHPVYRCPNDRAKAISQPTLPRTRSYSLIGWLRGARSGSNDGDDFGEDVYPGESKQKLGSVVNPSATVVFLEDHEQSIDDGLFAVFNPITHPDQPWVWYELPTDRHNQGCNLSFADGHAEHWPWRFPKKFIGHGQTPANKQQDPQRNDLDDLRRLVAVLPGAR